MFNVQHDYMFCMKIVFPPGSFLFICIILVFRSDTCGPAAEVSLFFLLWVVGFIIQSKHSKIQRVKTVTFFC